MLGRALALVALSLAGRPLALANVLHARVGYKLANESAPIEAWVDFRVDGPQPEVDDVCSTLAEAARVVPAARLVSVVLSPCSPQAPPAMAASEGLKIAAEAEHAAGRDLRLSFRTPQFVLMLMRGTVRATEQRYALVKPEQCKKIAEAPDRSPHFFRYIDDRARKAFDKYEAACQADPLGAQCAKLEKVAVNEAIMSWSMTRRTVCLP
jgi:hypothetical protein